MTEHKAAIDLTALGGKSRLSQSIRDLLSSPHGPLVVELDVEANDGKLTPESIRAIGDAIGARLKERGAPQAMIDHVEKQVTEAVRDPGVIARGLSENEADRRVEVLGAVRSALKLLEDTPDIVREMARARAGYLENHEKLAQASFYYGTVSSSIISAIGELRDAIEGLESHTLTCACATGAKPAEPKPETPPVDYQAAIDAVRAASGLAPEGT